MCELVVGFLPVSDDVQSPVQDVRRLFFAHHTVTVDPLTLESPADLVLEESGTIKHICCGIINPIMPEKAVELMIFVSDLQEENRESDVSQIFQIFSEKGFQTTPFGDKVQALALHFQPFEHTQENEGLIKECVAEIKAEFPDLEVEYSIAKNRDAGKMPEKTCQINVNT